MTHRRACAILNSPRLARSLCARALACLGASSSAAVALATASASCPSRNWAAAEFECSTTDSAGGEWAVAPPPPTVLGRSLAWCQPAARRASGGGRQARRPSR